MRWTNKGHEFDEVGHLLAGMENLYIYGARQTGTELFHTLIRLSKWLKWKITFIDADTEKQQSGFLGFKVLPPDELKTTDAGKSFVVVCASEENTPVMMKKAEEAGFVVMRNLFDHYYFLHTYISVHFLYNFDKVYISSLNIVPSTVCNLNCKGCLNFNPYIKEHVTYDFDSLTQDVDALFASIDFIGRFQVTGGEPLLYSKLTELIEYIGKNYRDKIVFFELVTNGTIVPTDTLCVALKKYSTKVFVDDYRNSVTIASAKYPEIIDKLREYEILFSERFVPKWFNLTPELDNKNSLSEQELITHYTICENPWATITNKSITACNYAHYAYKAGISPYNDTDYFDLTKTFSKEELVEYRLRFNEKGYTELCNCCAGFRNNHNYIDSAVQMPRKICT